MPRFHKLEGKMDTTQKISSKNSTSKISTSLIKKLSREVIGVCPRPQIVSSKKDYKRSVGKAVSQERS